MAPLRVGVIGCGAIAQACHLRGYQNNPDAELVAVADPVAERLSEVQGQFGVPTTYTNYRDMLEKEQLDAVSICTPNAFHAEAAIEAATRKIHIFCEKPIAATIQQAHAMKNAVEKSGVIFMVNFTHRYFEGNIAAKAAVDRNEIGAITMFRIRFSHGGPYPGWAKGDWFYDPNLAGGGALLDMGIHAIDLARHMVGPITSVFCRIGTLIKEIDVEDTAALILDINDGCCYGLVDVSWTSEACFTGVELYGTNGSIIVDYLHGVRIASRNVSGSKGPIEWRKLEVEPTAGGWSRVVDVFLDHVRRNVQPATDITAGVTSLRVALSAYESARTGRRIAC